MITQPIQNEEEHALALKEISKLMDLVLAPESPEGQRLDLLVRLVQDYEAIHYPMAEPNKLNAILFRVEQQLNEIHPGEILLDEFMNPMCISAKNLASGIGVSPRLISEIILGKRPITSDIAIQLGKFFAIDPNFWLNLQSEYELRLSNRAAQKLTLELPNQNTTSRPHKEVVVELLTEDPELIDIYLQTAKDEAHLPGGKLAISNAQKYVAEARKNQASKTRFANVWQAIETTPSNAAGMQARSMLMMEITSVIQKKKMTQVEAAKFLGVSLSVISDLMLGRINKFDLETLLGIATHAGFTAELRLSPMNVKLPE